MGYTSKEENLKSLSNKELACLFKQYYYSVCLISEILVEHSKCHLTQEETFTEIRNALEVLNRYSPHDNDLKEKLLKKCNHSSNGRA